MYISISTSSSPTNMRTSSSLLRKHLNMKMNPAIPRVGHLQAHGYGSRSVSTPGGFSAHPQRLQHLGGKLWNQLQALASELRS